MKPLILIAAVLAPLSLPLAFVIGYGLGHMRAPATPAVCPVCQTSLTNSSSLHQ